MGIGKRLKEARKHKNITQQQLADMVGVTGGAIGNYENETSHPRDTILYSIMQALEVDANFLFQDEMKKNIADSNTLNELEHALIEKYRRLNDANRQTIDITIDSMLTVQEAQKGGISTSNNAEIAAESHIDTGEKVG